MWHNDPVVTSAGLCGNSTRIASDQDNSDCVTLTQNNLEKLVRGQVSNLQLEWTKVDKFRVLVVGKVDQVPRYGKFLELENRGTR